MPELLDDLPPVLTVDNPEHRIVKTVFLPAKLEDNPLLTVRDPGYRERLYQSGEKLARALLDGDWSVFAGQFLSEFTYASHTCAPFDIPANWTRFRGYDWGFASPFAMLFLAKEPSTGRLYVYKEIYEHRMTDPEQAEKVKEYTEKDERFSFTFADPSIWIKRSVEMTSKSTFDVFLDHQIYLTKADNDQVRKAKRLRSALANIHDGKPGLLIFRNCKMTILELEGLITDPDRPEVPDRGQTDHAYDALCYALTNYMPPSVRTRRINKTTAQSPLLDLKGL